MESFSGQRVPLVAPSSADWSSLRPIVRQLYHGRRYSMDQVRDHLGSLGYQVNTRMVRARITQWNLQRNNQIRDMTAALRLLNPDPVLWPSPEPSFLIRGRRVTMSEVLRFFRRKGIQNPVQWAHSSAAPDCRGSRVSFFSDDTEPTGLAVAVGPARALLPSRDQTASPRSPPITSTSSQTLAVSSPSVQVSGTSTLSPTNSSMLFHNNLAMSSVGRTYSPRLPMHILTLEQRAVANLHSYCSAYIALGHAATHQEPQVHQFTTHGRFGDRMQEGLAQMMHRAPGAFPNFRRGFDLIRALLSDCHPMALAQFLAVICELAANRADSVLSSLLRYTAMMANSLKVQSSLIEFLLSISSSQQVSRIAISSLRAALRVFVEQSPSTWHRLYIQERLCDCFYHGKERTEGSANRVQLLQAQESFYGPFKRNVLWTVTNVADDHLHSGNVDGAKEYYSMALARAAQLTGFGQAKIRFAAFEGLARTEKMRSDHLRRSSTGANQELAGPCLQEAYRFIDGALNEALIWFDPTSRRISRVKEQRRHIGNLLENMGYPKPSVACSENGDLTP